MSREVRDFAESYKIKLLNPSPYYAQANGQAESSNKTLIGLIKKKIADHPRRWHEVRGGATRWSRWATDHPGSRPIPSSTKRNRKTVCLPRAYVWSKICNVSLSSPTKKKNAPRRRLREAIHRSHSTSPPLSRTVAAGRRPASRSLYTGVIACRYALSTHLSPSLQAGEPWVVGWFRLVVVNVWNSGW